MKVRIAIICLTGYEVLNFSRGVDCTQHINSIVMKMVRVSRNVGAIVIFWKKKTNPRHLRLCWPWYKCPPDCIRVTCKDVL